MRTSKLGIIKCGGYSPPKNASNRPHQMHAVSKGADKRPSKSKPVQNAKKSLHGEEY